MRGQGGGFERQDSSHCSSTHLQVHERWRLQPYVVGVATRMWRRLQPTCGWRLQPGRVGIEQDSRCLPPNPRGPAPYSPLMSPSAVAARHRGLGLGLGLGLGSGVGLGLGLGLGVGVGVGVGAGVGVGVGVSPPAGAPLHRVWPALERGEQLRVQLPELLVTRPLLLQRSLVRCMDARLKTRRRLERRKIGRTE
jgi:hypothetical protein